MPLNKNERKKTSGYRSQRLTLLAVGAVLFVAAGLAVLELSDTTYLFHARKAVTGVIPSTPVPKPDISEDKNDASPPSSQPTNPPESPKQGDDTTSPPPVGSPPRTPTGDFVSNHHPNLDGSPAPSSMLSVCNTTPGATCRIDFTGDGGITKTLSAQSTDANGATYWNWDVKQAGFTAGSWKITVTATLNGQTTAVTDSQTLEVGP